MISGLFLCSHHNVALSRETVGTPPVRMDWNKRGNRIQKEKLNGRGQLWQQWLLAGATAGH